MIRILLAFILACGGGPQVATSQPTGKPPAAQEEKVIERPGYLWVHGHWDWQNNQWNWVNGRWEKERPGFQWRDGEWQQDGDVWHWHDGSWVGTAAT